DFGILFGSPTEGDLTWADDYSGYLAFFDGSSSGDHEIRVDRWDNGGDDRTLGDPEPISVSGGESYIFEIDYGDTSSGTIELRVLDPDDESEIATASLEDGEYSDGYAGFYRHQSGQSWYIDEIGPAADVPSSDFSADVETGSATNVTDTSAEFNATVDVTGGDAFLDFDYWEDGSASDYLTTDGQTVSESGSYSETVDGLEPNTDYNVEAVIWNEDRTETQGLGGAVEFTTDAEGGISVTVDAPDEIEEGETAEFEITVENNSDEERTVNVDLYFGDVTRPADLQVTADVPDTVGINEDAEADITIENTGDESGETDYEFIVDGSVVDDVEGIILDSGESETLSEPLPTDESGTFNWEARVDGDSDSGTYEVTSGSGGDEYEIITVDDFNGGFDSAWTERGSYATVDDADAEGGEALYRTEVGVLEAGPGDMAYTPAAGDYFAVFTVKWTGSGGDAFQYVFDGDGDWSGDTWPDHQQVNLDWGDGDIAIRIDNDPDSEEIESASLPTDEYVTCVVQYDENADIAFWAYDSDETELAYVESTTTSEYSGYWGLNPNATSDEIRVGVVEFHEQHPITGRDHSELIEAEGDSGGGGETDATEELLYTGVSSPSDIYNINDHRGGDYYFSDTRSQDSDKSYVLEYGNDSKVNNSEYRFTENGYGYVDEIYFEIDIYPTLRIDADDTVRVLWAPLTNGVGSSGSGDTDGTNGWSVSIGFSDRLESPSSESPPGYKFFAYSYHMDKTTDSGEFEMTDEVVWMDQWNSISGYVKCNTYDSGGANADGVMRYWVNGTMAYERTDFRFTTESDNEIEGTGPLAFVLSSGKNGDQHWYDNHRIWLGGDIPDSVK
ncbi:MAG: CARDB domain-containing protein, partial [Halanaeroarchaeum sp.]